MTTYAPPAVIVIPWTQPFAQSNGAGGDWTRNQSNAQLGGGFMYSGITAPTGNYVEFRVALGPGTYTFTAIGIGNTFYGISTVTLDGTSVGTLDWYSAAPASNGVKTITGITVTTAGVYTLRLVSTTKNASATHYSQAFNLLALHRSDDASGPIVGGTLPHRVDIIPWAGTVYANNATPTITQSSAYLSGGRYLPSATGVQNAYSEWLVPLAAGTWSFTDIHQKGTDRGIQTWAINGTSIGTIDAYAGVASSNNVSEITGITVAQDGIYKLRVTMATKHASSSAYSAEFHHLILQRTGA